MNRRVVRTALVSPVRHNPVTGTCLLMPYSSQFTWEWQP